MDAESERALEEQQDLVESSLAIVFQAYDEAISANVDTPVVMLVDCEDELGGQIARGWLSDEEVDDAIASREPGENDTTVFATTFAWRTCCNELPSAFPYLAPIFESPPPSDGALVISVTSGGASALTAPFEARPDGDAPEDDAPADKAR